MRFPRRLHLLAAVVGVLLPIAPPASAAAANHIVIIDHMKFAAIPPLNVGDRVTFVNKDMFRHTVTATDNRFSLDLAPGARGTLRINSAGSKAFYCKYHPGMRGTLVSK